MGRKNRWMMATDWFLCFVFLALFVFGMVNVFYYYYVGKDVGHPVVGIFSIAVAFFGILTVVLSARYLEEHPKFTKCCTALTFFLIGIGGMIVTCFFDSFLSLEFYTFLLIALSGGAYGLSVFYPRILKLIPPNKKDDKESE